MVEARDPAGGGGRAEITVTVELTDAPSVQILSPLPSNNYYSDSLILFQAQISDSEDDPTELQTSWSSSLDDELPITAVATSDGLVEQYLNLSAGQHAITLTVTDSSGKSDSETVAITVGGANTEPSCSITAPESGSSSIVGQSISFAGTAMDDDINNSLLTIEWASDCLLYTSPSPRDS